MTDPLPKLFGTPTRVKLLRLFLFNPKQSFTTADAAARARVQSRDAAREVKLFLSIGLIEKASRTKIARYTLDSSFKYTEVLQGLLLNPSAKGDEVVQQVRKAGAVKLVILSGIFMGEWEARLDMLVVGERINEKKLQDRIRKFEAELGRELRYASVTTDNFYYRLNMSDKLVRDILDYPHRIVLDKLNMGLK